MNRKQAGKNADDILEYIVKEADFTPHPAVMRNARERLILTIMLNGEVKQGFIDSLVRIFDRLKEMKERESAQTVLESVYAGASNIDKEIMA